MTDGQTLFNILVALVGVFGGYYMSSIKEAISKLQQTDKEMVVKLQEMEVLVIGQYVKQPTFDHALDRLSETLITKLDKIESKLDSKTDKTVCEQIHHTIRKNGGIYP